MFIFKSQIDRIIELSSLTPAEKIVVISLIRRGALTARDISAATATSPRAVYYALEMLTNKKALNNNAGIYSLKSDYMTTLCKKCKDNARARNARKLKTLPIITDAIESAAATGLITDIIDNVK